MKEDKKKPTLQALKPGASNDVALALIAKLVAYEHRLDSKQDKTPAERRHVEYLRGLRKIGFFGMN